MLPLIGAAAAAIPSIFQGISGMSQARRGRKMAENNKRPVYERPSEVKDALKLSETNYLNSTMPGSSKLKSELSAMSAGNLGAATQAASSGGDVLDAITKLDYNQGQQLNDLAVQEAAYKDKNLGLYQDQLSNSAQYADKEFAYNKDQPYQDTAAAASALIEGGNTNVGNMVNGLSSIGTSLAMNGLKKQATLPTKSAFNPLDAALTGPLNFTGKKMIYDPYGRKISSAFQ